MAAPTPQGPALPWGAPPAATEQAEARPDSMSSVESLGLSVGARIEVKWSIHVEGSSEPYDRWWGATIQELQRLPIGLGASATHVCQLCYDASPADGFDQEERAEVALLSEHRLVDLGQREAMWWRREGEQYEPRPGEGAAAGEEALLGATDGESGSEAEGGSEDEEGGEPLSVSMSEVAACTTDADVAACEANMMERLGKLDAAGQAQVAAGYRDFVDNLKAFISAKMEAQAAAGGGTVTITADDMEAFKESLGMAAAPSARGGR